MTNRESLESSIILLRFAFPNLGRVRTWISERLGRFRTDTKLIPDQDLFRGGTLQPANCITKDCSLGAFPFDLKRGGYSLSGAMSAWFTARSGAYWSGSNREEYPLVNFKFIQGFHVPVGSTVSQAGWLNDLSLLCRTTSWHATTSSLCSLGVGRFSKTNILVINLTGGRPLLDAPFRYRAFAEYSLHLYKGAVLTTPFGKGPKTAL